MIRAWFQNVVWASITTYLVILNVAYSQPVLTPLVVGEFGLGKTGQIMCLVIGVAWASAYATWQYGQEREARQRVTRW